MHGYAVLEARNGPEALDLAERHVGPIDLLLSDVAMPEMTGPELARWLVRLRPGIAVLFVSGQAHEGAGLRPPLPKPFTPEALVHAVRETLEA